ncbi:hypothetical protein ACFQ51_53035 [Streptomyces kaempferi]
MDLTLLRPLYTASDPVVSVHIDTSREDQDADHRLEVGWRALRRDLEQQGADERTLAVLDEKVGGSPHLVGPQGESLFAAAWAPARRLHPVPSAVPATAPCSRRSPTRWRPSSTWTTSCRT